MSEGNEDAGSPPRSIVLIGGGQASYATARTLRENGFTGAITMIGREPHPPYERPPLSKAVLLGEAEPASTYLATIEGLAEQRVTLILDEATAIGRDCRRVATRGGASIAYDRLLIATGGQPRRLNVPGSGLSGVFYLRDLTDAERLRAHLDAAEGPLVVIGGGWIGLEVAATARKKGAGVTVVEALDRLCARALPANPAAHLLALHRARGVDIRLSRAVARLDGDGSGTVAAVILDDGERIAAATVVVGIGMVPETALAQAAGLDVGVGIVVDATGRTSDSAIFAAGDVAETLVEGRGRRIESWANANEQAVAVASAMLALPDPVRPPPWFWSDQFDANVQVLGEPDAVAEPVELGDPATGAVSWVFVESDRLRGVVAINRPRDVQAARRIMQRDIPISRERLSAPGADLAALLRAPAP
jgi:3-phenylpropionate/trans-cinnamate dioxygenase ferredoxin reductase subunit